MHQQFNSNSTRDRRRSASLAKLIQHVVSAKHSRIEADRFRAWAEWHLFRTDAASRLASCGILSVDFW